MIFDEKLLGLVQMFGGLNATKSENSQNAKMPFDLEKIMKIGTLMQSFQGKSGENQHLNGTNNMDIMKILPLISALKSGNAFPSNTSIDDCNPKTSSNQNAQNDEKQIFAENKKDSALGFKDKYSAITFAGNEVIYSLGKLWKTYKI